MAGHDPFELVAVFWIAADCAEREVLGPGVGIDIKVIDETNTRVHIPATALALLRQHDNFGMVALVGVQSNQYPRALDIARPFRAAGIQSHGAAFTFPVVFRCSTARRSNSTPAGRWAFRCSPARPKAGLDKVLQDAAYGELEPVYNFMNDLPGIGGTPVPFLPKKNVEHTLGLSSSFDAGRGCPYQCSFCTIINVQGRKSRSFTDDIEAGADELGAGHPQIFHHRRQLRPQQGLGSDLRPAD